MLALYSSTKRHIYYLRLLLLLLNITIYIVSSFLKIFAEINYSKHDWKLLKSFWISRLSMLYAFDAYALYYDDWLKILWFIFSLYDLRFLITKPIRSLFIQSLIFLILLLVCFLILILFELNLNYIKYIHYYF